MSERKIRPLPGLGKRPTAPMQQFVVMFREPDAEPSERSTLWAGRTCHTGKMVEEILSTIRAEGLQAELEEVGDPTGFGMVSITGTNRLADRLRRIPGVEAVVAD